MYTGGKGHNAAGIRRRATTWCQASHHGAHEPAAAAAVPQPNARRHRSSWISWARLPGHRSGCR